MNVKKHIYVFVNFLLIFFIFASLYNYTYTLESDMISASSLEKGIELYHKGRYDEALAEFNAEVKSNEHCPLAYYYAARIRFLKKQYSQASKNLLVAISDSSHFNDAVGFLAFVLKEMGETNEAVARWRSFVAAVDSAYHDEKLTINSIMLPELYRDKVNQIQKEQLQIQEKERQRLEVQEKLKQLTTAEERKPSAERITTDTLSVKQGKETMPSLIDSASTVPIEEEIETQFDDLDHQIRSDIRKGIYIILAVIVILTIGITAVVYWIRKRSITKTELSFTEEVDRFLQDREESEEESEFDRNRILDEYREKIKTLSSEAEPLSEPHISENITLTEFQTPMEVEERVQSPPSVPRDYSYLNTNQRHLITREIKTLVMRMYREGHTVEEISRTADLSRSEVELIIAVRTKRIEQLIHEVSQEVEESEDTNTLYHVIHELRMEGNTPREIAKKIGVSTGEVNFIMAVLEHKRKL